MLKATIINSGSSVTGYVVSPDGIVNVPDIIPSVFNGFGRFQLDRVLLFHDDTRKLWFDDITSGHSTNKPLQTGQQNLYCFKVNSDFFKITLVWIDPPAAAMASKALINDLDLVVSFNGAVLFGNQLPNNVFNLNIF